MQLKHYEIVTDADKLNVDKYSKSDKICIKLDDGSNVPEKYINPDGSYNYFAVFEDICKPYKKK